MQKASSKKVDESKVQDEEKLKKIREELKSMRKVKLLNTDTVKLGQTRQVAISKYNENPLLQVSLDT